MSEPRRVSVVFVTYNSASVIDDALRSLPEGVQTIVVDNASSDDTLKVVKAQGAEIVHLSDNVGFGNACNVGAQQANHEFLLFLNPDAVLQTGALEALVAAADKHPKCAALNPRILRSDGSQFFRVRSHLFPETRRLRRETPNQDRQIKVLSGAAVLIRRQVFADVGGFDPNIFLYCEDDDLGLRFSNAGWQVRYVHDAVVVHQGNQSSAPSPELEKAKAYHEMRSRWYTARKHAVAFSRPGQLVQSVVNFAAAALTFNTKARVKHSARIKALCGPPPRGL